MAASLAETHHEWWQTGIIYQIYPRSFMDANGDGVGDLAGIIQKLDYCKWLGVDAIWLSPIFPSPMADFGYDVSDYCGVHPIFGTLEDFDRLLSEAHRRNLKVLLDFVPNHTSDQHPWFQESKSSRTNPKRNWYLWKDPAEGGKPPNNWLSTFGGSAWEYDESTQQYYYHAFLDTQPDLNWRNPEVQQAMQNVLKFWLERGVDGFRIDVIYHIVKDEQFRANPANPNFKPGQNPNHEFLDTYTVDQPEVHEVIRGLRKVIDAYDHRMMVGEIYLPVERLVTYYGEGGDGVHLPFNFQLITLPWNAQTIGSAVEHYERSLPSYGWPNWVLGNHDNARLASRVGLPQARVAAMLLLTLRGTPTMYYGEEIGMQNVDISREQVQDPFEKNVPGMGLGRDPERTPMQWSDAPNAGFAPAEAKPWLPIANDSSVNNVETQVDEPVSMLALYRHLITLRKATPALTVGEFFPIETSSKVLLYGRRSGVDTYLIALNFSHEPQSVNTAAYGESHKKIVLSTFLDKSNAPFNGGLSLRADEGVIIRITDE